MRPFPAGRAIGPLSVSALEGMGCHSEMLETAGTSTRFVWARISPRPSLGNISNHFFFEWPEEMPLQAHEQWETRLGGNQFTCEWTGNVHGRRGVCCICSHRFNGTSCWRFVKGVGEPWPAGLSGLGPCPIHHKWRVWSPGGCEWEATCLRSSLT